MSNNEFGRDAQRNMIMRQAAQQALAALEQDNPFGRAATIRKLRAALAEEISDDKNTVQPNGGVFSGLPDGADCGVEAVTNIDQRTGDHFRDATKMVATIKDCLIVGADVPETHFGNIEPVAWLVTSTDLDEFRHHEALVKHVLLAGRNSRAKDRVPLYATPPSQAPLTAPENAS